MTYYSPLTFWMKETKRNITRHTNIHPIYIHPTNCLRKQIQRKITSQFNFHVKIIILFRYPMMAHIFTLFICLECVTDGRPPYFHKHKLYQFMSIYFTFDIKSWLFISTMYFIILCNFVFLCNIVSAFTEFTGNGKKRRKQKYIDLQWWYDGCGLMEWIVVSGV